MIKLFFKTTLYIAVEKENIEIIKLLLTNDKTDINKINVLYNQKFQYNLKLSFSIAFILFYFNHISILISLIILQTNQFNEIEI